MSSRTIRTGLYQSWTGRPVRQSQTSRNEVSNLPVKLTVPEPRSAKPQMPAMAWSVSGAISPERAHVLAAGLEPRESATWSLAIRHWRVRSACELIRADLVQRQTAHSSG